MAEFEVKEDLAEKSLKKVNTQKDKSVDPACVLLNHVGMFSGVKSTAAALGELEKARLLCRSEKE